ncbi:MAG: signal recognition particle protein, partial [Euryarchaeota archaeon HGW-Euryarchaeota-1]
LKKYAFVINSCTKEEKKNPEIINPSRMKRIAAGSGVSENEVAEFFKQFKVMKTMMAGMQGQDSGGKLPKKYKRMMEQFK